MALDRADIGERRATYGDRLVAGEDIAEPIHVLGEDGGADHVDPLAVRQLDGGGPDERLDGADSWYHSGLQCFHVTAGDPF